MVNNINETSHSNDELFLIRQILQLGMDNISFMLFWKDCNFTYLGCNKTFAIQAGLNSQAEVVGKSDFDLPWEDLANDYRADDLLVIKNDSPKLNYEELLTKPDGSQNWIRTSKLPLHNREGKVIGVLGISEDITERRQTEEEIAIANEKLISWVADLEQRNQEATMLRQMGDLLQVCNEREEYYSIIKEYVPRLFPTTSGALFVINDSQDSVEAMMVWGDSFYSENIFTQAECWALRRNQIHKGKSSTPGLNCHHILKSFSGFYLEIPMIASGETIGVLHIGASREDVLEYVQNLALSVAGHLSLSLSNMKLRETLRYQSIRDALTGLFNRRYMEETLARELPRANRKNSNVGIIMMDIDHFKHFNDTYGHEAGDEVLRELGKLLQHQVRTEDIVCRYGGEEFILILPEAGLEVTTLRADLIRQQVKNMVVEFCHQPLGVITISLGVAIYPQNSLTSEGIIKKADDALYLAKHNGRDRVEVAALSNP